jgi:hypothetical protein
MAGMLTGMPMCADLRFGGQKSIFYFTIRSIQNMIVDEQITQRAGTIQD